MEVGLLVTLIDKTEKKQNPIALPDPIEAVRETIERKGFKDKDLIPAIVSKTTVSLLLNRKRALTIDMIRNLSVLLVLPLKILIQAYKLTGKPEKVNPNTGNLQL
jgi:HTH-type transcriptional regulator/antitoxin HigA